MCAGFTVLRSRLNARQHQGRKHVHVRNPQTFQPSISSAKLEFTRYLCCGHLTVTKHGLHYHTEQDRPITVRRKVYLFASYEINLKTGLPHELRHIHAALGQLSRSVDYCRFSHNCVARTSAPDIEWGHVHEATGLCVGGRDGGS
jgi:hypothetical protein